MFAAPAATIRLFLLIDLALGGWLISPVLRHWRRNRRPLPSINNDEEIVYIDIFGVIRVIDPWCQWPTSRAVVQPDRGLGATALGDFNNDGDMEIVAITDEGGPKLTIYDPVVTSEPVGHRRKINGLYWATFYELTLPAAPNLIGTGNFNPDVPATEIVVVYDEPHRCSGQETRLQTHVSAS